MLGTMGTPETEDATMVHKETTTLQINTAQAMDVM
jgi:hypothetical protein